MSFAVVLNAFSEKAQRQPVELYMSLPSTEKFTGLLLSSAELSAFNVPNFSAIWASRS